MRVELRVNGAERSVEVPRGIPLLWVLRDELGLTGTKFGCGIGQCGACTVHLDGEAARSCMIAADEVGDREVTTIEGLSEDGDHPVQRAWVDEDVAQCGYCQAGQIMAAAALLARSPLLDAQPPDPDTAPGPAPRPSDREVRRAMAGNLCRCGTYVRIRRAIRRAAGEVAE